MPSDLLKGLQATSGGDKKHNASKTEMTMPVTGDDPRLGHGYEDRDLMNDRTKSEVRSLPADSTKGRVTASEPVTKWDEKTPSAKRKQRGRTLEPYLTWLGQSLRQSYEEILNEPVPESFTALLDRLEQEDEDRPSQ